jgi:glycosyltransferase involved in cell wall biosynthesis
MFLIIFPGYQDLHFHKDVLEFGDNICTHLGLKAALLVSRNEGVNYDNLSSRGMLVYFLKQHTGIFTIDVLIFLASNIRLFKVVQLFHLCRFSFVTIIWVKLLSAFIGSRVITIIKADHNGEKPNAITILARNFYKIAFFPIDLVTFETRASYIDYRSLGIFRRTMQVRNGVFTKYSNIDPAFYLKENSVIFAGRISEYQKNAAEFLDACPIFLKKHPDWSINVIGEIDSELAKTVTSLFDQFPELRKNIFFHGYVDRSSLEKSLSRSKILVLTSRWEGLPAVFNEAQYWGVRVVSSELHCLDEAFKDRSNVRTYQLGNVIDLANRMSELALDDDYYKSGRYLSDRESFAADMSWLEVTRDAANYLRSALK